MYSQRVKEHSRQRLIKNAVKSLTTDRTTSVCVQRDYVRKVWQQLKEQSDRPQPYSIPEVEDMIAEWEKFHDSETQKKNPSDLRVCYLAGEDPTNDLRVFKEAGVIRQNIWGVENVTKKLNKASESVGEGTNIKLFHGSLKTFLKDMKGRKFDIIYFDACGCLTSKKQETLETIGAIFFYDRLASPGALISNFSFPPVEDSHKHIISEFLTYKLWDTTHSFETKQHLKTEVESRVLDDLYSDYVTYQIIDSASTFIPIATMLFSEHQSLWEQLYNDKRKFLKHQAIRSIPHSLLELTRNVEYCESNCEPCETWCDEILLKVLSISESEDENSNPPKKKPPKKTPPKLSYLAAIHLLSNYSPFILQFTNTKLQENLARIPEDLDTQFHKTFLSDGNEKNRFSNMAVEILYGQLAHPSFLVKSLRLKYTAKTRPMYADVFIFDKCRYLYDHFPSVHNVPSTAANGSAQVLIRIIANCLRRHFASTYADKLSCCNFGESFDTSEFPQLRIPKRESLNFNYFKERGDELVREKEFEEAKECYDTCEQLCSEKIVDKPKEYQQWETSQNVLPL